MKIRVTLDIYSGRPNPSVELTDESAQKIIAAVRRISPPARMRGSPVLGYRGVIIEQLDRRRAGLPHVFHIGGRSLSTQESEFERFILGPSGPFAAVPGGRATMQLARRMIRALKTPIDESNNISQRLSPASSEIPAEITMGCEQAPIYEPGWWNDQGLRELTNNCYNYATNHRTDTFAQPGRASGPWEVTSTCNSIKAFSIRDNLVDAPDANNQCPGEGHLVALVLWPGTIDFHWYRKGRDGFWTHKPGPTPATDLDSGGNMIPDPRSANRGPYTDFCGFLIVQQGHIKLI